ncbi:MAG: PaaI family thioesterase [Calditrichaeota bacterium]|nr:PaaI family thioesterase [Calditrichota bacterium]
MNNDDHIKGKIRDSFKRQAFMKLIGAELVLIDSGYCEIKLPYKIELSQQHGYFHAGAVSTIADNACGYAAFSLMEMSSSILTVEFKINLLAPATGDYLLSKARVIKAGKTLTVCTAEVFSVMGTVEKKSAIMQSTLIELKNRADYSQEKK